ncbi:hypothetical protein JSO54_03715 [Riemerella anatipestifer]|uniref:PD-(D/E)XK nuclease family protein n=1 Tax=Riemerella anatipestifer TaxID=34085 RepID=UPI0030BE1161
MSLLAKFFNQIKSSQEDIASDGLKHILQNSIYAKKYLQTLIFAKTNIQLPELNYTNQISKNELGRTDISGVDINGDENLIIEAKFWASLTENQPISYLKRINKNGVLLFVCPTLRKSSLFVELKRKLNEENLAFVADDLTLKLVLQNRKQILVQSWNEILEPIKEILKENNQQKLVSDIDQVIGFCEVIDSNSFIPLSENDLSPEIGRKISSYYSLVDEVISELSKNENYKQDRLTEGKPAREAGYYKYRKFKNYGVTFGLNFNYWTQFTDTPFWLKITELDFKQSENLKFNLRKISTALPNQIFENSSDELFYPIYPLKFSDKDKVIKEMTKQIVEIYEKL